MFAIFLAGICENCLNFHNIPQKALQHRSGAIMEIRVRIKNYWNSYFLKFQKQHLLF